MCSADMLGSGKSVSNLVRVFPIDSHNQFYGVKEDNWT